jgi:hypothetical protein
MEMLTHPERLAGGEIGPELLACLRNVAETTVSAGPKYHAHTLNLLTKWIACRSYGGPLHELCHLALIADEALGVAGYEKLFWSNAPATGSAYQAILTTGFSDTARLSLTGNGIRIQLAKGEFAVTWSRMPAIGALMDFLVSALGYGVVDEALRGGETIANTANTANTLSRALYGWLGDQLPGLQAQRRFRTIMAFVSGNATRPVSAEDIDDAAVFDFWLSASADPKSRENFRSFKGTFQTMAAMRDALAAARERDRMQRSLPLGSDRDNGEIDAGEVETALDFIDDKIEPLKILGTAPLCDIKFLKKTEITNIALLIETGPVAAHLPLSLLRAQIFGATQGRVSQGLRRGLTGREALAATENETGDYQSHIDRLESILGGIDQTLLAVFHLLADAYHDGAVALLLALRPDMDLSPLAGLLEATMAAHEADNVVTLYPSPPLLSVLRPERDQPSPVTDLDLFFDQAKRAAGQIKRAGFNPVTGDGEEDHADGLSAGADALLRVQRLLRSFLHCLRRYRDEEGRRQVTRDRLVFDHQFNILYGAVK